MNPERDPNFRAVAQPLVVGRMMAEFAGGSGGGRLRGGIRVAEIGE